MDYSIINSELLEALKNIPDNSFDGCFCDHPYEIGFMGKKWDGSGVAFQVETWAEVLRILKPGAHLIAFGGTRTYHRLACAIEDAGFDIRDSLMWVYGSGFPKSLDISKVCDKSAGVDREIIGKNPWTNSKMDAGRGISGLRQAGSPAGEYESCRIEVPVTAPATNQAKLFQGYGTALKPAYEPCILARKPIEGTVAVNCVKYGCGGLNIDGCRVTTEDKLGGGMVSMGRPKAGEGWDRPWMHDPAVTEQKKIEAAAKVAAAEMLGRFPANLIHDGSDDVVGLFPVTKSGTLSPNMNIKESTGWAGGSKADRVKSTFIGNEGSAARFFYTAKASKKERGEGNNHPCVKPLSLCEYLSKLILPPVSSRLLVPFSGSGSEMIGALKAGWSEVVGIEREPEYVEIAKHRIENMKESVSIEEKGPIQGSLFEVEAV